jgi:hypothetical protein
MAQDEKSPNERVAKLGERLFKCWNKRKTMPCYSPRSHSWQRRVAAR